MDTTAQRIAELALRNEKLIQKLSQENAAKSAMNGYTAKRASVKFDQQLQAFAKGDTSKKIGDINPEAEQTNQYVRIEDELVRSTRSAERQLFLMEMLSQHYKQIEQVTTRR